MRVEAGLALAGLRHRPGSWLLLAIGIAVAAGLPVIAAGLRAEATVASVRSAVDELPQGSNAVLAVTSTNLRGDDLAAVDRTVRTGYAAAGLVDIQHSLTFRQLAAGGADFTLGGMDRLADAVALSAGRLPRSCTPTRCEVVAIAPPGGDQGVSAAAFAGAGQKLGLVVTGAGILRDQRPFGMRLVSGTVPLLLSTDPTALSGLSSLDLFGRSTAWYGTLDGAAIAAVGVPSFTRTLADIAAAVNVGSGPLTVTWPSDPVTAAGVRAAASADRFGVLGVGAAVLQLGFALVVAAGIRRRQQLVGSLLTRRGASAVQVTGTAVLQTIPAVLAGLLVGAAAGVITVGIRSSGLLQDPWHGAWAALAGTWPTLAWLGVSAVVLTVAVLRWSEAAGRATTVVLDVLAVLSAGFVVLTLVVGSAGSQTAGVVVVLVAVVTGLIAARLMPLLLRGLSRLGRGTGPVRELAVVSAGRRPLLAMVTAGFVAAACCSLMFAGGYRASLQQSAVDQAAAAVPLDVRVAPSISQAVPLDSLDVPALSAAAPGVTVRPVVSTMVTVFAGSTLAGSAAFVGLEPAVLTEMHQFADTTGSDQPASVVARSITAPVGDPAVVLPVIPAGAIVITLAVAGANDDIEVKLWLSTPQGREQAVALTRQGDSLTATLALAEPATVRAVEIAESASHLVHRQHGVGEGSTDRALASGTLRFGPVTAAGRPVDWPWAGWGSGQATVSAVDGAGRLPVGYEIGDSRVILAPDYQPLAAMVPLPVLADPGTAATAAGAPFGLSVNGGTVPAIVVGVLPRMPTIGGAYVVADRSAVTAVLDRTAPGTAAVTQVWIGIPPTQLAAAQAALASSPAATADLTYRTAIERSIAQDPVALRSMVVLALSGLVALLLTVVAGATAVRSELAQSAGDHFALELDGLPAAAIRRSLVIRSALILILAVPIGVLAGWLLTTAAVQLLVTGPGGGAVTPPLRAVAPFLPTTGIVVAALVGGLLAAAAAVAGAFRERLPAASEWDLR